MRVAVNTLGPVVAVQHQFVFKVSGIVACRDLPCHLAEHSVIVQLVYDFVCTHIAGKYNQRLLLFV